MSKKNDNRTSLEKSHSKSSNAKLTLLCFVTTILVSVAWASLALLDTATNYFFINIIVSVASLFLTFLCVKALGKFTR